MKIEDKLEIVISTFNRCEELGITFSYLLGENSPVKNCDITILDNCSTDDTPNLVKKIAEKHPNIKYRRNARNIGVWGNVLRSYEIVSKEYFWILGSDDSYNWECWDEVERAISEGADFVFVGPVPKTCKISDPRVFILVPGERDQVIFLIQKTANIYDEALALMWGKGVLACWLLAQRVIEVNPTVKIVVLSKSIVIRRKIPSDNEYTLDFFCDEELISYTCFCKDKKLKNEAIRMLVKTDFSFPRFFCGFFSNSVKCQYCWLCLIVLPWKWKLYMLAMTSLKCLLRSCWMLKEARFI